MRVVGGDFHPLVRLCRADVAYDVARGYAERAVEKSCRFGIVTAHALFIVAKEAYDHVIRVVERGVITEVVPRRGPDIVRNARNYGGVRRVEFLLRNYALHKLFRRRVDIQIVIMNIFAVQSLELRVLPEIAGRDGVAEVIYERIHVGYVARVDNVARLRVVVALGVHIVGQIVFRAVDLNFHLSARRARKLQRKACKVVRAVFAVDCTLEFRARHEVVSVEIVAVAAVSKINTAVRVRKHAHRERGRPSVIIARALSVAEVSARSAFAFGRDNFQNSPIGNYFVVCGYVLDLAADRGANNNRRRVVDFADLGYLRPVLGGYLLTRNQTRAFRLLLERVNLVHEGLAVVLLLSALGYNAYRAGSDC